MTTARLLLLIAAWQTKPSATIAGRHGEIGGTYNSRFDTVPPPTLGLTTWSPGRCAAP